MSDEWEKIGVNTDLSCVLRDLSPATEYAVRVVAENELGAGEPSEPIVVQTEGEAPAGEPQNLVVTATASDQLRVTWTAPLHHLWNGDILGYYVGYREHGLVSLPVHMYNFTSSCISNYKIKYNPIFNGNKGVVKDTVLLACKEESFFDSLTVFSSE